MNWTQSALFIGVIVVTVGAGCVQKQPYISNELDAQVLMRPTEFHEFTYVRAYEDDGELVIYGKCRHTHGFCEREGHVDLVIEDDRGIIIHTESLPLRRQSSKKRGWYGAGFRTKVALDSHAGTLRLAFHDAGCHTGYSFDCDSNQAVEVPNNSTGCGR